MSKRRVATLAIVAAELGALFVRKTFLEELDALERLANAQDPKPELRTDLPPEVAALAARLGASAEVPAHHVDFGQTGTMNMKPGGPPQRFIARRRIGTLNSGCVWRARIGRLGQIAIVDSFFAGQGMLEARLLGVARVAKFVGKPSINQGELLRYLAELPLNPDAILFDHALVWAVADARTIVVANRLGRCTRRFTSASTQTS